MISKIKNMFQSFNKFLQEASAKGSRSNVIKPLLYLIAVFISALTLNGIFGPTWITIILAILLCVFAVFFVYVFGFCLIKNPDLLRSEKYQIDKMVTEHLFLNQTKETPAFDVNNIKKESYEDYIVDDSNYESANREDEE